MIDDLRDLLSEKNDVEYAAAECFLLRRMARLEALKAARPDLVFFILCLQGRMVLTLDGERKELAGNDLLVVAPSSHTADFMTTPVFRCRVLGATLPFLQRLLAENRHSWMGLPYLEHNLVLRVRPALRRQLYLLYRTAGAEMAAPTSFYHTDLMHGLFRAFVFRVLALVQENRAAAATTASDGETLLCRDFMQLLAMGRGEMRTVSELATALRVSPKHLARVVQKVSGRPPKDWLKEYVRKAILHELQHTTKPMKEIALTLHFANEAFFSNYVRKMFGLSPRRLRDKLTKMT